MDKSSEIKAIESLWNTLDDSQIIRDVLFKGKYIQSALKFIAKRRNITNIEAKEIFREICDKIVLTLIHNKQTFRAAHVLKNAKINELYYFYSEYKETDDSEIKTLLYDYLSRNANFKEDEIIYKAYYSCYKLLIEDIERHAKFLDNVNKTLGNSSVTVANIKTVSFSKFMNQPVQWRNDISMMVFFKSKRDSRYIDLLPILVKDSLLSYILQNEKNALLRKWLNEQYICKVENRVASSGSPLPTSFDNILKSLFRKWQFEESMINEVSKYHKDVIKNEFAKLGLFDNHESKQVKKLNRIFTTQTFVENSNLISSKEVTKFVIDQKHMDLLPQKFIDHDYIQSILQDFGNQVDIYDELVLLESMKNLLSKETNLDSFMDAVNASSKYLEKYDAEFNPNQKELKFMSELMSNDLRNLHKISDINTFTRNLFIKLSTDDELPRIEDLIEDHHSIKLDYIRSEFQNSDDNFIPNFDDPFLSNIHGEKLSLIYLDYIKKCQGVYASYIFIADILRTSMTITKPIISNACEEVVKLAINEHENVLLVVHCIAFLEIFSFDTRSLRCYLKLLKLKSEDSDFEEHLDRNLKLSPSTEDIKNIEALEVYWNAKKFENPQRTYISQILENDNWFRLIVVAQYFNYPLDAFIRICKDRIKNKILCDNLIRAVSYEAPIDQKRSVSTIRQVRKSESTQELFANGKFLDAKNDLFAILLKCDEKISRNDLPFEKFQKYFVTDEDCDDLLYQAKKNDWPLLAVLAATTKAYRFKYCWLMWTTLSSNFKWHKKYDSAEEVASSIFEHLIRIGFIRTLSESVDIFYPETPLKLFTTFLKNTLKASFENMDSLLKLFIVQLSEKDFRISILKGKHVLIPFIIRCLIIHLQYNIKFVAQQKEYLACLHRSEIAKLDGRIDFELLEKFCGILEQTNVEINYVAFYEDGKKFSKEINRICDELISNNNFEAAIEIASLMNKSKTDFIFKYWLHMRKTDNQKQASFDISKYIKYVYAYNLNIDMFIKFLRHVIDEMDECAEQYNIMIFILRNTGKSDLKELDELEYEINNLYIRLKLVGVKNIKPLTSLYYENVIKTENCLVHNNLYELKEIARIDELKISQCLTDEQEIQQLDELIYELLDINDIVQVFRIQAMFCYAPEDLKILVYMLSVAEGITSIYDITRQERKTISSYGQLSNKFNKFGLRALRTNSVNSLSMESSTMSMDLTESTILEEPLRYLENKETLQALQGLLYKLKHGIKYGQRIVLIYRVSLFLHNQSFNDLIKIKNPTDFLELVATSYCDNKLLVMSDIIEAMEMCKQQVAKFIAKEITVCIIKTRFLQFNKDMESSSSNLNMNLSFSSSFNDSRQSLDDIWGFSLSKDLHLILELCKGKTALLGTYLVKFYKILSQPSADIPVKSDDFEDELKGICEYLNNSLAPQVMSLKKQNIIRVELLVTAHSSFCNECSTEGIGEILNLSKIFTTELAEKKNFNLIVKLMCGIGRYREMFYCFDILIKNEAFETILSQFSDRNTSGLKNALLSYLREYHPDNIEYYKMCASHFMMYTELAKLWRTSALDKIKKMLKDHQIKLLKSVKILSNKHQQMEIPYLKCTKNALAILNEAISDMINATEMMTADKKIEIALKYSSFCELIAMQINLLKVGHESDSKICPCVLFQEQNAEKSQLMAQYLATYDLTFPQSAILNKNVEISVDYTKAIFCRVLIGSDEQYLYDFMGRHSLTDSMIENIVKLTKLEAITKKQEKTLHDLCLMIRDVGLKFRVASLLGLKDILQKLLNDEQSYYYLLDSKYGNVDVY